VINSLRTLSGVQEIAAESTPLWGLSGRAKLSEQERLRKLMPRLSDEFLPPITKAASSH